MDGVSDDGVKLSILLTHMSKFVLFKSPDQLIRLRASIN